MSHLCNGITDTSSIPSIDIYLDSYDISNENLNLNSDQNLDP